MTDKVWHALTEVTQQDGPEGEQALIEHLAAAVDELRLPPAFLARMKTAVAEAIRRARQHDTQHALRLTMATRVLRPEGGQINHSWGFFLIEKRMEHGAHRRIEVLLYPETRP